MSEQAKLIKENLAKINENISKASKRIDRNNQKKPCLVAVSKNFDKQAILPALKAGQRVFGENRVQEAKAKWVELKNQYKDISLHLIGPLQTNKIKDAVKLFDVIETVDREKLAKKLKQEMVRANKDIACFVQVNIGEEPQKAGIMPKDAVSFVKKCQTEYGLNIIGLMAIPPKGEEAGPFFAQLNQLAKQAGLKHLSMGMSKDYQVAIMMGATYIRVGSAIFGKR